MKKQITLISSTLSLLLFLSSCESSVENDAKKLANITCKYQELAIKAKEGDNSAMTKSLEIMKETQELKEELGDKYEKGEAKKEFEKAVLEAMSTLDCK